MLEKIEVTYAHIPRGNWETFVTEEGKYQLRINVQYERQNAQRQVVQLSNAIGEEYFDHFSDNPFTLQEVYDFMKEDTANLIEKVKREQSGYNYTINQ